MVDLARHFRPSLDAFLLVLLGGVAVFAGAGFGLRLLAQRCRMVKRDLDLGTKLTFKGTFTDPASFDFAVRLFRNGLIATTNPDEGQTIDALAGSGRLLRANGVLVKSDIAIDLSAAGADGVAGAAGTRPAALTRPLSRAEKVEVARLSLRWLWFAGVAGTVSVASYLVAAALLIHVWPLFFYPPVVVLVALSLLSSLAVVAALPHWACLRKDADSASVVRHEVPAGADPEHVGSNRPLHEIPIETLYYSGRTWTVNGHPARWRKQGGVALQAD